MVHCKKCYIANFVNYYDTPPLQDYRQSLVNMFKASKRILFVGLDKKIIRYDMFGIDYDNTVLGFIDMDKDIRFNPYTREDSLRKSGETCFFELEPDLIFITKDPMEDAEYKIKNIYKNQGFSFLLIFSGIERFCSLI